MKALLPTLCAALGLATPALAVPVTYLIDVTVTNAPNVPNIFPGGPEWAVPSVPLTYSGTFLADPDTNGPISDLSLEVAGVDVGAAHPVRDIFVRSDGTIGEINEFSPSTLTLIWAALDTSAISSFVSIGNTTNTPGVPADRIVALQNTDPTIFPPGDPIFLTTISWEGTFTITKGTPVPETGATLALAALGLGSLLSFRALGRKSR